MIGSCTPLSPSQATVDNHQQTKTFYIVNTVLLIGFEPITIALEEQCSSNWTKGVFVATKGFEPINSVPKTDVLPLHQVAILISRCKVKKNFWYMQIFYWNYYFFSLLPVYLRYILGPRKSPLALSGSSNLLSGSCNL